MKKIILIITLSLFSFSAFAETFSIRVFTISNFTKSESYQVKTKLGINYSKNNYRVGINEGFDNLPVVHALKTFPVNNFLTFGTGLETGYTAYKSNNNYYLKEDFGNLNFMLSLNVKIHKNFSIFLTSNNASLEINFQ